MEVNYVSSIPKDAKPLKLNPSSFKEIVHNYDEILLICKKLHNDYVEGISQKKTVPQIRSELKSLYPEFEKNYFTLFKLCTSDDYDIHRLTIFIQMASSVQKKEIAEKDASIKIGEMLVNDYVKPKLNKP